jgi:hypothetical protein
MSAAGGVLALAGVVTAAASGWSSPTGLAAFITALVGAGAFVWSIFSARRRGHEIDLDAARELLQLVKETRDEEN